MAGKTKSQRQIRKWLLRRLENTYDFKRLEWDKRVTPHKHMAKLTGMVTALVVYTFGFGLAYYGWKTAAVDQQTFGKFVWLFMLPASVIGVFSYSLSSNRRQYTIAQDVMALREKAEAGQGMLWRFEPVLDALRNVEGILHTVMTAACEGRVSEVEPEDYAKAVSALHAALDSGELSSIGDEAVAQLERNLGAAEVEADAE